MEVKSKQKKLPSKFSKSKEKQKEKDKEKKKSKSDMALEEISVLSKRILNELPPTGNIQR